MKNAVALCSYVNSGDKAEHQSLKAVLLVACHILSCIAKLISCLIIFNARLSLLL